MGAGRGEGGPRVPAPPPFLPGPRFPPSPPPPPPAGGPGRGGARRGGGGRASLIRGSLRRPAEEMPPRAGKGARGRGGGRAPAQGPALPPLTQLIGLGASAREGTLQGAEADRDQGARPPARARGLGGGGGTPPSTPGPRTASPPPHWLGLGGGSELGCPLEIPSPSSTHFGARIRCPGWGWARAPITTTPGTAGSRLGGSLGARPAACLRASH